MFDLKVVSTLSTVSPRNLLANRARINLDGAFLRADAELWHLPINTLMHLMLANCSGLFASKAINRERSSLNALISHALGFACCRILAAMINSRPTDESKQVKETRLTFVFAPFS